MNRSRAGAGAAGGTGRGGGSPAGPRGPVRGRSLGLLEDMKKTNGRVNGGWGHAQSQADGFDSCLSERPPQGGGLLIYGVAALNPGGGAAVDVGDRGVPELLQVAGGRQAALPAMADGQNGPIAGDFADPLLQLPQRDQLGGGDVALLVLPGVPDIEQEWRRLGLESFAQLSHVDAGDRSHRENLSRRSASFTGHPASFSQREQGPAIPAVLRLGRAQAAARLRDRRSRSGRRQPLRRTRGAAPAAADRVRKPARADRLPQPQPAGCRQRQ